MTALALWWSAPGRAEILPAATGSGLLVETLFSGISRGTERLVSRGEVPADEAERMRAPFQQGEFTFPIKYGYSAVGRIGDGAMAGRAAFALFPHQDRFRLPEAMLFPLPETVPPARAVLASNMETALNILWDSGAGAGDRVAVFGAGLVGLLVAGLAARLPGAEVTLIDPLPARSGLAQAFGCGFAAPDRPPVEQDVVIHCSGAADGLATALASAGQGATVIEASWHGDHRVALPLGAAFHSRRLRIVSSQVGGIPEARAPRWTHARRLRKAISLLADDRLDRLISGETSFRDMARCLPFNPRRPRHALPSHPVLTGKGDDMFAIEVRDHIMIAHSLPDPVFGPAQSMHGATYTVDAAFMTEGLDRTGLVVDIGLASEALAAALAPLRYKNLDELPELNGKFTTTEFLCQHIFDQLAAGIRAGKLADQGRVSRLRISLQESHLACAWYEAAI